MLGDALQAPVLLTQHHDIAQFDCGKLELNQYLLRFALQNQASGGARTYVALRGARAIGFYSLAPASVAPDEATVRVLQGQGRYPVPVILMARFAVNRADQGQGLGKAIFRDALQRALAGAEVIGGRAFVVHAKDDEARAFYLKYGMEPSLSHPMHLFLLFKDIRQSLKAA